MSKEQDHGGNHGHHHIIHYTVDDEPESTTEKFLTPVQIMRSAGVDPDTNYLEQLVEGHHEPISYKDSPDKPIEMKEGMRFITKPTGPMPVS